MVKYAIGGHSNIHKIDAKDTSYTMENLDECQINLETRENSRAHV